MKVHKYVSPNPWKGDNPTYIAQPRKMNISPEKGAILKGNESSSKHQFSRHISLGFETFGVMSYMIYQHLYHGTLFQKTHRDEDSVLFPMKKWRDFFQHVFPVNITTVVGFYAVCDVETPRCVARFHNWVVGNSQRLQTCNARCRSKNLPGGRKFGMNVRKFSIGEFCYFFAN